MKVAVLRARYLRVRPFLKEFYRRIDAAGVRIYSASIAYHSIVAFVSLVSVVLFLAQASSAETIWLDSLISHMPDDVQNVAQRQADQIAELNASSIALVTIIGLLIGLWGLASGFAALYDALNRIHGTHQYTPYALRYGRALGVAVCFTGALALVVGLVAAGSEAGADLFANANLPRLGSVAAVLLRLVALVLIEPVVFALLLRYGSRARPPWGEAFSAGVVSAAVWLLFAVGFGLVVQVIHPYGGYGAFGTALTLLVFAYCSCYVMLCCVVFAPDLYGLGSMQLHRTIERRRAEARAAATQQAGPDSAKASERKVAD